MIENELTNLFALVGSIRANAEKVGKQINDSENAKSLIDGITEMCDIAEVKLSIVKESV